MSHVSAARNEQIGKIVGIVAARAGAATPPMVADTVLIPVKMAIDETVKVRKRKSTGMRAVLEKWIETMKIKLSDAVGKTLGATAMMKIHREIEMTKIHCEAEMTKSHRGIEMMKNHRVDVVEIGTVKEKGLPIEMSPIVSVTNCENIVKKDESYRTRMFKNGMCVCIWIL